MVTAKKPKKWVTLTERVDVGGEVRRPEEGPILIDGERAEELIGQKKAKASAAPKPSAEPAAPAAPASGAEPSASE